MKINYHKDNKQKDGLYNQCKVWWKKNYNETLVKIKKYYLDNLKRVKDYFLQNRDKIKEYQLKNHEKIITRKKIYSNNRYKTDINFRLITKTRSRIRQALVRKTKSFSTIEILGSDIETSRRWIESQFTTEINWSNIEIDHVKPICVFDIANDEELRKCFNWKNTQPLLKEVHQQKGIKFNFLDNQIQFIEANQFLQLKEDGPNQDIHWWIIQYFTWKKFPTKKRIYNHIDEIWSIGLADVIDYKFSKNKGYRYIFVVTDNFSKYLWCFLLKNKNSQIITNEYSNILTTSKRRTFKLESDRGSNWYNSIFQNFLKAKIIQHFSRFTDKGPSVAERVIRILRNLLKKAVFEKDSADWLSEQSIVFKIYSNTTHHSIKMTPIQASKKFD